MGTMHPNKGQLSGRCGRAQFARQEEGRRLLSSKFRIAISPPVSLALAALTVLLALALSVRPAAAADDLFGRDKALHFGASASLALAGYGSTALFTERPAMVVSGRAR